MNPDRRKPEPRKPLGDRENEDSLRADAAFESGDHEIISAYLDGECTSEEQSLVEERLSANAELRQLVDELRAVRGSLELLPQFQLDADFAQRVLRRAERDVLLGEQSIVNAAAVLQNTVLQNTAPQNTTLLQNITSPVDATSPLSAVSTSSPVSQSPTVSLTSDNRNTAEWNADHQKFDRPNSLHPFVWAMIAVAAGLLIVVMTREPEMQRDPIAQGPEVPRVWNHVESAAAPADARPPGNEAADQNKLPPDPFGAVVVDSKSLLSKSLLEKNGESVSKETTENKTAPKKKEAFNDVDANDASRSVDAVTSATGVGPIGAASTVDGEVSKSAAGSQLNDRRQSVVLNRGGVEPAANTELQNIQADKPQPVAATGNTRNKAARPAPPVKGTAQNPITATVPGNAPAFRQPGQGDEFYKLKKADDSAGLGGIAGTAKDNAADVISADGVADNGIANGGRSQDGAIRTSNLAFNEARGAAKYGVPNFDAPIADDLLIVQVGITVEAYRSGAFDQMLAKNRIALIRGDVSGGDKKLNDSKPSDLKRQGKKIEGELKLPPGTTLDRSKSEVLTVPEDKLLREPTSNASATPRSEDLSASGAVGAKKVRATDADIDHQQPAEGQFAGKRAADDARSKSSAKLEEATTRGVTGRLDGFKASADTSLPALADLDMIMVDGSAEQIAATLSDLRSNDRQFPDVRVAQAQSPTVWFFKGNELANQPTERFSVDFENLERDRDRFERGRLEQARLEDRSDSANSVKKSELKADAAELRRGDSAADSSGSRTSENPVPAGPRLVVRSADGKDFYNRVEAVQETAAGESDFGWARRLYLSKNESVSQAAQELEQIEQAKGDRASLKLSDSKLDLANGRDGKARTRHDHPGDETNDLPQIAGSGKVDNLTNAPKNFAIDKSVERKAIDVSNPALPTTLPATDATLPAKDAKGEVDGRVVRTKPDPLFGATAVPSASTPQADSAFKAASSSPDGSTAGPVVPPAIDLAPRPGQAASRDATISKQLGLPADKPAAIENPTAVGEALSVSDPKAQFAKESRAEGQLVEQPAEQRVFNRANRQRVLFVFRIVPPGEQSAKSAATAEQPQAGAKLSGKTDTKPIESSGEAQQGAGVQPSNQAGLQPLAAEPQSVSDQKAVLQKTEPPKPVQSKAVESKSVQPAANPAK